MSDFARIDEAIRVARGPWTQQALAGGQAQGLTMAAGDTAMTVNVSLGNTSTAVQLPPGPLNGDFATVRWMGNPSRMATVTSNPSDGGLTIRQGPVNPGELWRFRYTSGAWRAVGP